MMKTVDFNNRLYLSNNLSNNFSNNPCYNLSITLGILLFFFRLISRLLGNYLGLFLVEKSVGSIYVCVEPLSPLVPLITLCNDQGTPIRLIKCLYLSLYNASRNDPSSLA